MGEKVPRVTACLHLHGDVMLVDQQGGGAAVRRAESEAEAVAMRWRKHSERVGRRRQADP